MLRFMLEKLAGELYRMRITDNGFVIIISRKLYDHLLEKVSAREELKDMFCRMQSALYTDIATFDFVLPFIPSPNHLRKKADWETQQKRAREISFLLWILSSVEPEGDSQLYLSEKPQLMAISTGCTQGGVFHGHPIEVGFHQSVFDILAAEGTNDTHVKEAEHAILRFYSDLMYTNLREKAHFEAEFRRYGASFTHICAMLRAGGTPHFVVPGDCACLGTNPDVFKENLSIDSHNMDSALQQLSMLAGLVSFWNDFLTPRWQAKQ